MKWLLINEKVEHENVVPSLGLAILGTLANKQGHRVKVIDYQITNAPPLKYYLPHLTPDVVGFRIVNENWNRVSENIDQIRPFTDKIIVGGPFPTLHYEELRKDPRIDAIFRAEAEQSFMTFLDDLESNTIQKVYQQVPTNGETIPIPDFTMFHNFQAITHYPLQLSRGCPYSCIFCSTKLTNSRKWRPRPLLDIFLELGQAIDTFNHLERIVIIDDNPIHDMERFKEFLYHYRTLYDGGEVPPLGILNIRADKLDAEVARLLQGCGVEHFLVGIETIGRNATKLLGKHISTQDIRKAVKVLKAHQIKVGGAFIIGLPGDDWKSVNRTIKFAQNLELESSCWGHLLPLKGTRSRQYVTVLNDYAETMVAPDRGEIIKETASETKYLPQWWQIKGWLRANIKTNPRQVYGTKRYVPKLLVTSIKYAEVHYFVLYLLKLITNRLRTRGERVQRKQERLNRRYCYRCKRFHVMACPQQIEASLGWGGLFLVIGVIWWIGLLLRAGIIVLTYSVVFGVFAWVRFRKERC